MNSVGKCLLLYCAFVWVLPAWSVEYRADVGESHWRARASVFECSLTHELPQYGEAIFANRAGERPKFYLNSKTSRLKSGKAALVAVAPHWKASMEMRDLGFVPVSQGVRPIQLGEKQAKRMLSELYQGMELVLTRKPWYQAPESASLTVSPINFRAAYTEYLDCLAGLLPVNYDQVSHTSILFASGGNILLSKSAMRKLDRIVSYVNADSKMGDFYIDGHADSKGVRKENFELSKHRAEMVMEYLLGKGISQERIHLRWHGERYPIASNRTSKGRAKNRRVTVRVDRREAKPSMAKSAL